MSCRTLLQQCLLLSLLLLLASASPAPRAAHADECEASDVAPLDDDIFAIAPASDSAPQPIDEAYRGRYRCVCRNLMCHSRTRRCICHSLNCLRP